MKKTNRNLTAYIRQPNIPAGSDLNATKTSTTSPKKQTIFNEIIQQMDGKLSTYVTGLVSKKQKQENGRKSMDKLNNHQRAKSYADILITTPSSTKNVSGKGYSYRERESVPTNSVKNIFFSSTNSPTNQKQPAYETPGKMTSNNNFIDTLGMYINELSTRNSTSTAKNAENSYPSYQQKPERKTVQRSRQNSLQNLKIADKIIALERKQKQLAIANAALISANNQLMVKLQKQKEKYSGIMSQLIETAKQSENRLKHEKKQKQRLERIIAEFQQKLSFMRPQRKTLDGTQPFKHAKYYENIQDLLISQATDPDESIDQSYIPEMLPQNKTFKKRSHMPRNSAGKNFMGSFNMEQLSAMLANNNYAYDNDDESQIYQ